MVCGRLNVFFNSVCILLKNFVSIVIKKLIYSFIFVVSLILYH
jgi:hypothetical protein